MKMSDVDASSICALCCSPTGQLFLLDVGLSAIYRLDLARGDCITVAKIDNVVDISFFGVFLVVLLPSGLMIMDHKGNVLKKHNTVFSSKPVAVCNTLSSIIVTGADTDIWSFQITY